MAEGKIRVQPTGGKYLNINLDGVDYEIYLVNPKTGEQGTYIPRSIAIRLLAHATPLISVVPEIKDGAFVVQFTPEELKDIEYLKDNPRDGKAYTERKEKENAVESVAQDKLIEAQEKLLADKDEEIKKLKAELEKKNKKGKKSEE